MNDDENRSRGGRRRAFEPEAALDAAMRAFWKHGYEATSLAVLREAMGLTSPQIYNAFIDKEALFRAALDRYLAREAGFALEALAAPVSARKAVARLLFGAAAAYADPSKPGGCLFVTGALAASPAAHAIAQEMQARRRATQAAIAERLRRGLAESELPAGTDPEALARYYTGVIHGMSIQARDGASAAELESMGQIAMRAWPHQESDDPA